MDKWTDFLKYFPDHGISLAEPEIAKKIKAFKKGIIRCISDDIARLKTLTEKITNIEYNKGLFILNNWEKFSPYYLWTVKWFRECFKAGEIVDPEECDINIQLTSEAFNLINADKDVQRLINFLVVRGERKNNIPSNLSRSEFVFQQYANEGLYCV